MALSLREKNSLLIKELSSKYSFQFCGISKAQKLDSEEKRLEEWLSQGMHGKMNYMANHFEKRLDPVKLVPGAKSVVTFIYNYYPKEEISSEDNFKIARYAYGKDYHFVIRKILKELVIDLQEKVGEFQGRIFVDSAPVMERAWAARSGIGWIGKNSLLLNRNMGSYFFLAVLISELDLIPDNPIPDYCGSCTRCMDACPTDAIADPYVVDGSKCISYLTIELKDEIPSQFSGKFNDWIFGCDICQEVCPWNRFARPTREKDFSPVDRIKEMKKNDWVELDEIMFEELFRDSPLKRTGFKGLKRNITFAKERINKI